jgi:hypothetical protein
VRPAPRHEDERVLTSTTLESSSRVRRSLELTRTGVIHHPVVGELSVSLTRFDLSADHELTIFIYATEPGSRSEEALKLLGSWAATADPAEPARPADQR